MDETDGIVGVVFMVLDPGKVKIVMVCLVHVLSLCSTSSV